VATVPAAAFPLAPPVANTKTATMRKGNIPIIILRV
jgi:hypothetical protein